MFPKKGNKFHHQVQRADIELQFVRGIAAALHTELGSTHQATKTVMHWTGASDRSVKHWFAGTHGPSGAHLIQLMRHSDEVVKCVLYLADRRVSLSTTAAADLRKHLLAAIDCLNED
jgi:hypothetical protein